MFSAILVLVPLCRRRRAWRPKQRIVDERQLSGSPRGRWNADEWARSGHRAS